MPTECTPKRFNSPYVAPTRTVAPAHGSELMFALELRRALFIGSWRSKQLEMRRQGRRELKVTYLGSSRIGPGVYRRVLCEPNRDGT